jgi:predicted small secreted protein
MYHMKNKLFLAAVLVLLVAGISVFLTAQTARTKGSNTPSVQLMHQKAANGQSHEEWIKTTPKYKKDQQKSADTKTQMAATPQGEPTQYYQNVDANGNRVWTKVTGNEDWATIQAKQAANPVNPYTVVLQPGQVAEGQSVMDLTNAKGKEAALEAAFAKVTGVKSAKVVNNQLSYEIDENNFDKEAFYGVMKSHKVLIQGNEK